MKLKRVFVTSFTALFSITHEHFRTVEFEFIQSTSRQAVLHLKLLQENIRYIVTRSDVTHDDHTDALKIACGPEKIPGVDEFVPIFIYTILKANPPCLHSNIEYLSHFRHPSRMLSESGYYFVSFLTAVSFIESLDASMLSIDAEEFENLLSGKTKPAPENEGLDLEPDDSSLSEWVWIKKKGPSVYISEKKLFSHLFIRAREERKRSLFDLRASTSFLWSRQSNDIKKLIDKKPEELSFDEIRLLQQECKRLLALQEKSKK
jgi:hypothetical protein